MATTFDALRSSYRTLWNGMVINADKVAAADAAARRILAGADRYKALERSTGVPWFFIGLCHLREGNLSFETYLGNGQSLHRATTIVPVGRGPFATFEAGAVDALTKMGFTSIRDWSLERIGYCLEGFNGYGYRAKGVNSPYLWAGTNRYVKGKYIADHVFDANAVDKQLGSMAVLSRLCALNGDVNARVNGGISMAPLPPPPDVPPVNRPLPMPAPKPPVTARGKASAVVVVTVGAAETAHAAGLEMAGTVVAVVIAIALVIAGFVVFEKLKK